MNRATVKKMRTAHNAQARKISRLPCFGEVKRDFGVEYRVAVELARARKKAKMTQQDLAAAMGTTQSVISRIERGTNVSIETLERYVAACGYHLQVRVV